jgi:hypothetical protein
VQESKIHKSPTFWPKDQKESIWGTKNCRKMMEKEEFGKIIP